MHLNIGPGPHYAGRGWVNVELEGSPYRRDLTGSLLDLPPDVVDVELAYCGHLFEHVPIDELARALPVLRNRMVPGGTIAVVGPDVLRAQDHYDRGLIPKDLLDACHITPLDPTNPIVSLPGGPHVWDCTAEKVEYLLQAAGFRDVREVDITTSPELSIFPVVSRVSWQCAVIATAWPDDAEPSQTEPNPA